MNDGIAILLKIALLLMLLWMGFGWFEHANLYFPDRQWIATPKQAGLPYEDISLQSVNGRHISSWFIPVQNPSAPTILLCHGNAGNISHRLDKAARLHQLGLNVFLFDYEGYGHSEGRPIESTTYEDAEAAYLYLVNVKKIPENRIILYGESLGGAVATEMALRHHARALILESAFTSTVAMANRLMPWLPARIIVRNRYDNLIKIPRVQCPILFLHSKTDEIVPFVMAQQLYQAATTSKQIVELQGDHNEGYIDSGKIYPEAINSFIKSLGGHP